MSKVTSTFTKKKLTSTFTKKKPTSTFVEGGVDYVATTVYYFVTEDGLNYIITEDDKYIIKE